MSRKKQLAKAAVGSQSISTFFSSKDVTSVSASIDASPSLSQVVPAEVPVPPPGKPDSSGKAPVKSEESDAIPAEAQVEAPSEKSDYELLRDANIRRNQGVMEDLGLEDKTKKPKPDKKKRKKKEDSAVDATPVEARRSKRNRGEKPDYTAEKINDFGEELDRIAGSRGGGGGGGGALALSGDGELKSRAQREAEDLSLLPSLENEVQRALEAQREAMSSAVTGGGGAASAIEHKCRDEAVKRWGDAVLMANPPSWEKYLLSRTSVGVPSSPMQLLQERYAPYGAWHLLIACNLMTRVSSAETKHRCIEGFFGAFPTPTACLHHATAESVQPIIASLGLFPGRYKGIVDITRRFLMDAEFDAQRKGDCKIYGIGEFGVSSFEIWVRGLGRAMVPEDATLRGFCAWLRKSGAAGDGGNGSPQEETEEETEEPAAAKGKGKHPSEVVVKKEDDI